MITHWYKFLHLANEYFSLSKISSGPGCMSMAHSLSSHPFLLTPPPPHSRLTHKRFTIFAKRAGPFTPIRSPKPSGDSEAKENESSGGNNGFSFNFDKLPEVKSLIPVVSKPSSPGLSFFRRKDARTVFVAGATGQAGTRIAQTLLREGFSVRAGVPEIGAAQELASLAAQYKIISNEELKRLNAVESTFQDPESIARSIGNAAKVVITIGPTENGPSSEVSTSDALQVIQAAQLAGVSHVAIIYDGNPSSVSNSNVLGGIQSFFNNIFTKSQPLGLTELLEKVVETDVQYTLIKTSLTDDFSVENTYNVAVAAEGRSGANDFKVSKLQIASLVAGIFSNTVIAENKVVEVFTDPSAPSKKFDDLFSVIPEDGRRKAYTEAKAEAEASEAARKLEEAKKLSEAKAASSSGARAQEKAVAAGENSIESFLSKGRKKFDENNFPSWEKLSTQFANAVPKYKNPKGDDGDDNEENSKVQVATVRGQAKAMSLKGKKALFRPEKKVVKPKVNDKKEGEVKKLFGGLYKQETIYIDDD